MSRKYFRCDVLANESYNGVVVEGILLEYGGSSSGGQFLSGLEKTEYGSFDQFAVLLQYEQGSEQAGSVDVVSAGVHYARMDRRERNARILLNGKGIRIGPQHDTPFRIARSGDPGQKTRSCNPLERNTCFGQPIGKVIGRFMFLKREFGVGVQVSSDLDDLSDQSSGTGFYRFVIHDMQKCFLPFYVCRIC